VTAHGHACGGTISAEYRSWRKMRERCLNPRNSNYEYYGGRGISVCERWNNFSCFLADMGPRPAGHTLDRIDGNKGYEPSNCRWATKVEQARNTSQNVWIELNGERRLLIDWSERLGISRQAIYHRVSRGVTDAAKLLAPMRKARSRNIAKLEKADLEKPADVLSTLTDDAEDFQR